MEDSNMGSLQYKVYSGRWLVLIAAVLPNIAGGMTWLTFTPVAYKTAEFYGLTLSGVNWLSLMFLIASIPFGLLATWTLEKYGLKRAILLASWSLAIGNVIKILSAIDKFGDASRQTCLFIGQGIAACGQPFTIYCPAILASTWFPESQRAIANTMVAIAQPIGLIVAGLVPPAPMFQCSFCYGGLDVMKLLCVMASPSFLSAIFATGVFCYWSAEPPTPASASGARAKEENRGSVKVVKELFKNKDYVVILLCVGGGVGLFSTFATLLQQVLCPFGYTDDQSGFSSATLTVTGILGALVTSIYCDKTKQFSTAFKFSYLFVTFGTVLFSILFHYKLGYYILLLMGFLGMFSFGILPIGLELAAECTYPIGVATSSGLIVISGQIQSVLLVLILESIGTKINPFEYFVDPYDQKCDTTIINDGTIPPAGSTIYDLSVSVYVCAAYVGILLITLFAFFRPTYNRLNAPSANQGEGVENQAVEKSTTQINEAL